MRATQVTHDEKATAVTEQLAARIATTRFEDLPAAVVQFSKNSILDTTGVALAGAVEPGTRILARYIEKDSSGAACSLIGQGKKSSPRNAALANGTAAHMLGYSDLSVTPVVHPSISVLPAVLGLAEARHASGKAIVTAHVLGVEVACKLGEVVGAAFNQKGWHPCSVLGGFGATAGAAKVIGLDAARTANALGLAGMQVSGIKAGMGTMAKAYGAGRAAENGVVAAELAEMGFTGPATVLEGVDGFLQTFGDGVSGARLIDTFGKPYHFVKPGITLKPYPSCTCSHTSINAVLMLMQQHSFGADDVAAVECSVSPAVANYLKYPRPRNALEAKYSLQFCVAAALMDGRIEIKSFADGKVNDPRVVELMKRIRMTVSPELAALGFNPDIAPFGSRVAIRLKDGRELFGRQDKGPWEPETAPSWDELLPKFRSCAERVLDNTHIDDVIGFIAEIESHENITRLMDLIRA